MAQLSRNFAQTKLFVWFFTSTLYSIQEISGNVRPQSVAGKNITPVGQVNFFICITLSLNYQLFCTKKIISYFGF